MYGCFWKLGVLLLFVLAIRALFFWVRIGLLILGCFKKLGVLLLGVLVNRALSFWIHTRAIEGSLFRESLEGLAPCSQGSGV